MAYFDFGGVIVTATAKTASLDFDFELDGGGEESISVNGMGFQFFLGTIPGVPGPGTSFKFGAFGSDVLGSTPFSASNIYLPLLSQTQSGHFHFDVQYDEQKNIVANTNLGGHAYPQSELAYTAFVQPGYAVNISCVSNGVSTSVSQAIVGPGYFLSYDTLFEVTASTGGFVTSGSPTSSATSITYDAGPWSPISYTGTPNSGAGILSCSSGSIIGTSNPLGGIDAAVISAPTQQVSITGSILKGNDPSTDTIPCQYSPNSVNTLPYPTINAPSGVVSTTLTRYHSRYLDLTGLGFGAWSPVPPQDYLQGQPESLVIGGTYFPDRNLQDDSTCYRMDDTSWNVTTFSHATSVIVDSFTSNTGWSATNGTLTGGGVGIVCTAQPATLAKTSGYAKDFRNFRYVILELTTNKTGSVLALMLGTEIFRLPALMNGANSIKIDLCSPQIINCPDDSRSNWEGFCGNIRGVAVFDNIQLTGFAVGETVTLNSLTLTLSTAKGLCMPEDEPWPPTSYLEWYNPSTYIPQSSNGFAGVPGSTIIRACVLRDRADGKPAADIHCAISTVAAAFAQAGTVAVGAGDRINVADFITAVNAQVGLSCSAGSTLTGILNIQSPGDGLGPNPYSPNIPAAFLTFDSGSSPGSIDTNMTSAALNCQPFYATCVRFIGQQTAGTYNFIKRIGGAVHGLVISPGGPLAGINVLMSSADSQPPQNLTTDTDGYYRSAAQWPSFVGTIDTGVTLATNTCTGQVYIRTRAWRFLGLGGAGIGGCNDLLNCQFGFYIVYIASNGNLICKSAPHANMPMMDVGIIDTSNDCQEPHITQQQWSGLLSCVYTRGKGTIANPYRIYRAVSLDFGASWKQLGMISF